MKPSKLFVAAFAFAGLFAVAVPVARAAAADDAPPPPLPPPPEATNNTPATPAKPAAKPAATATKAADAATGDLPTMAQVQALFDAGNYNDLLKALSRVLPLKGKAAEPYDRQKLLQIKLDTHMKLKQQAPAIAVLNEMADDAGDDEPAKQSARAMVQLIKRSKAFVYTPKPSKKTTKAPAPLDITDPIARKAAMQAMLDEDMAKAVPKVKAAMDQSSLPPIASALEAARSVRDLEVGVTGSDNNSKAMVADLGAHGKDLITKTVEKMSKRVDEITKDANETIRIRGSVMSARGYQQQQDRVRRRGLKGEEPQELRKIINDLPAIAKGARELVAATGGKQSEADSMVEMCSELSKRAKKTLETDYTTF